MTSNEEERNQYIVANYRRRLDYMIQNNQVDLMYSFSIDRSRWTECESDRVRYPASLCWCLRFSFM